MLSITLSADEWGGASSLLIVWSKASQPWGPMGSHFSSVTQVYLTLSDPKDYSILGFPFHHQIPELSQTHVHHVGDAIQPSHTLSSSTPHAINLSQHQGIFQQVNYSHQVAIVLEFQFQRQSFQ